MSAWLPGSDARSAGRAQRPAACGRGLLARRHECTHPAPDTFLAPLLPPHPCLPATWPPHACLAPDVTRASPALPPSLPTLPRSFHAGHLSVNFSSNYYILSQRHAQVPRLTPAHLEAIKVFEDVAWSDALRLDWQLRPGDVQLLSNHTCLHSREGFVDDPEVGRRPGPVAVCARLCAGGGCMLVCCREGQQGVVGSQPLNARPAAWPWRRRASERRG